MSIPRRRTITAKDTIAVTLHVALEHHDRSELQEASALYREILGIDPNHADSLFLLGMIATEDDDREAAVQLLRAAVRNRPRAAHMHHALAEALMKANRAAAALQCYWRILALEPENPLAYVNVGDVLRALKPQGGNDSLAASCYRRAIAIDPACSMAHFGLGEVFRKGQDLARARAAYQAAIAVDGGKSSFHAALADVLYGMHQYAWAADAYRRAIKLRPQAPQLLHRLGDALARLGQSERAEACHLRARALEAGRIRAAQPSRAGEKPVGNLRFWNDRFTEKRQPVCSGSQDQDGALEELCLPSGRMHHLAEEKTA